MSGYRVLGGAGGGGGDGFTNFQKQLELGLSVETVLEVTAGQEAGFAIEQSPVTATVAQEAGLAVNTFASGTAKAAQESGFSHTNVLTMQTPPPVFAGFEQRHFINARITRYATSTINDPTASDNFTNPANGQGAPDGSNATRQGQLLASTQAMLKADTFETIGTTKDVLNIDLVELRWYAQQSGTVLNNGIMRFRYGTGEAFGSSSIAATFTDNQNFLTTPYAHDVTSEITTWDDIRNMNMWVEAVMDLAENLITVSVDAFEVYVEASILE